MKQLQLASDAVCQVCFKQMHVGTWVAVPGDCLVMHVACAGKHNVVPEPQQDLFEKEAT